MERDDLIVNDSYSVAANHDEEHGRAIRKKIVVVTILLTIITTVEVGLVKWSFIVMTLIKAGYIVAVFMHLGDEKKALRYMILIPYAIFILYLLFIIITESNYLNHLWSTFF